MACIFRDIKFILKLYIMKNNITGHVEMSITAPATKVWKALTDPLLVKQYFFGTEVATDWKKGSPIRFTGEWEGKPYEDKGTILDVQEYRLLKYNYWSSRSGIADKPENYVDITFTLDEKDGITTLTVTQENISDEEMRAHSEENWQKVLTGMKHLLEEKEVV